MSENLSQNQKTSPENNEGSGEDVKKDFKGLLGSTKMFLSDLLDIRSNTDQDATRESIIADIPFKGHTTWILICSIFIASIGLAVNSNPVVVGAMLISPLMGPILGIGMSLAINDIDTLRRSLKNFAVMVVLSVLTAYLFFLIPFIHETTSELESRTAPTILDVLVAFFGGLALVIARAKKGTIASVIFGVAIATALMPPLCTVGYGLAIGNLKFAGGASLLFGINTIFIALATFLVIKFLRFPMVRYANSQRRRLIARVASLIAVIVMIPAGITFFKLYQKSLFTSQGKDFIDENIVAYEFSKGGRFLEDLTDFEYNDGENSSIELVFMGNEPVPDNIISMWNTKKNEFSKLKDCKLLVIQGSKNDELNQMKYINELYESKKAELLNKDERIQFLESELAGLSKRASKQIPFKAISDEAKVNYENLSSLGFSYLIKTDFNKLDTIPVFEVAWKKEIKNKDKVIANKKLNDWLKIRLKDTKIKVREIVE